MYKKNSKNNRFVFYSWTFCTNVLKSAASSRIQTKTSRSAGAGKIPSGNSSPGQFGIGKFLVSVFAAGVRVASGTIRRIGMSIWVSTTLPYVAGPSACCICWHSAATITTQRERVRVIRTLIRYTYDAANCFYNWYRDRGLCVLGVCSRVRRLTLAKLVYRARSSASRATKAAAAGRVEVPEPRLRPANARALQIKVKAPQHSHYNRRRLSLLSLDESYPIVRSRSFAHVPRSTNPRARCRIVASAWTWFDPLPRRIPGLSSTIPGPRLVRSRWRVAALYWETSPCLRERPGATAHSLIHEMEARATRSRSRALPTRAPSQPSLSRPSSASRTRAAKSEFSREANPLGGEERKERETRATGYVH